MSKFNSSNVHRGDVLTNTANALSPLTRKFFLDTAAKAEALLALAYQQDRKEDKHALAIFLSRLQSFENFIDSNYPPKG